MKYFISAILLFPLLFMDISTLKVEAQNPSKPAASQEPEESEVKIEVQATQKYYRQSRLYSSEAEIPSRIYFTERGYGGYLGKIHSEKLADHVYKADFSGYLPPVCADMACPTSVE